MAIGTIRKIAVVVAATTATVGAGTAVYANNNPEGREKFKNDPKTRTIELLQGLAIKPTTFVSGGIYYVDYISKTLQAGADQPDQPAQSDQSAQNPDQSTNPDQPENSKVNPDDDSPAVAKAPETLSDGDPVLQGAIAIANKYRNPKSSAFIDRIITELKKAFQNQGELRTSSIEAVLNQPEMSKYPNLRVALSSHFSANQIAYSTTPDPAKPIVSTQPANSDSGLGTRVVKTGTARPARVAYASVMDDDLKEAEEALERSRSQNKEMLLKALRKVVALGINPAEKYPWYEEWATKNNVSPEMLVAQKK